ncbi:TIR domain-containing protein (plasmid) [Paracoccus marcusii]|uniref:TIR domain-containing protein n=1 Tax=Paracoccus marcusii TaxID=59779 RepID=UPI0038B80B92
MLPTVFLSLEGSDERYVEEVQRFLPDGLAYFYKKSFENGESLISAMEDRVGKSSMFVLFASSKSIASRWVGFEVDQARIAKIKDPSLKIIVIPTDNSLKYSDLPKWMRDYWVGYVGKGARDVARYIRRSLISGPLSRVTGTQVYGRGSLIDQTMSIVSEAVIKHEVTPNVLVVVGNTGIGRRTFFRKLVEELFPANPNITFGPEMPLPQFADLADMYRSLRQEIETDLQADSFEKDLLAFRSASLDDQVNEISRKIDHFTDLGQAVTILTGNGIYEDRGYLKSWVGPLFRRIKSSPASKLIIITNRSIHDRELRPFTNVVQVAVNKIDDQHIKTLMVQSLTMLGAKPKLPHIDIINQIGGHPGIAKAAAVLVARKGPAVITSDPRDFYQLQDDVLAECLNFENLSETQKDVLSVLSWVPQLPGKTLLDIICDRRGVKREAFGEEVNDLILMCLIDVIGANYAIAAPVRTLFRRQHGYGSTDLMKSFSASLMIEWDKAKKDGKLKAEILDAIAYMVALEGGTLPAEFKGLLLPSTLQEVVRDTYDRGHDDPAMFDRVINWGSTAKSMPMDETTREEILSYVIRAMARAGDENGSEDLLKYFDERRYRSRFYLRAFYLRVHHHDYKKSIRLLLDAKEVKKYLKQVVGDLARCYQKEGMWPELRQLVKDQEGHIGRNSVLLDVRIGMFIAEGRYVEAEQGIITLRSLRGQEIFADGRVAMMKMRRDRDFKGAQDMLTALIQKGNASHTYIRKLRAIAAASGDDLETARLDVEFLRARIGSRDVAGIEARIKLAEKDFLGAEAELLKYNRPTAQEELLLARIYETKADHPDTPFAAREPLKREATWLRAKHISLDEYEVDR